MERSKDWMLQAQGDLAHAHHDLDYAFYDWASFSAQQAAEKAVKAVLYRLGAEAWGHSVTDLMQGLERSAEIEEGLINSALELDKAYIMARYPDALPSGAPRTRYTLDEAKRMVTHAGDIVRFCADLLSTL